MSYIVCPKCKHYHRVNENTPLVYDKCENCGETYEFVGDDQELRLMLQGKCMPKISYKKRCDKCRSINPKETGACLYCGSTSFNYVMDNSSGNAYQQVIRKIQDPNVKAEDIINDPMADQVMMNYVRTSNIYKAMSIIIGLMDFFFFITIGMTFLFDINTLPTTVESALPFILENQVRLICLLLGSLVLSGFICSFMQPRMNYSSSFKVAAIIGIIIGLFTLSLSMDIVLTIMVMVMCGIITGVGGVFGELIVHKLSRKY
ncbi:MAG: hypothetical protein LUG89_01500 [Methanosphaera sp.]|nr:hypothetical protein [Methanosphaera sp.]